MEPLRGGVAPTPPVLIDLSTAINGIVLSGSTWNLIAKGRIPRPLGRDKIVVVRSPPIESESQALPGPPKFGNCIVPRDSGEGKQSVKSVCRGVRHEAALDQWRWAD